MNINVIGGGPGGLYASLLLKKAHPSWTISVWERNPRGATYGWGVVFSDQTLASLRDLDVKSYRDITNSFIIWDAINIYSKGELIRCDGHIFAGIARRRLLAILEERCEELGVALCYDTPVEDIDGWKESGLLIAADGVHSRCRTRFEDKFRPTLEEGAAKFIWYGTDKPFDAFTFIFRENEHGLFTVHAYPFDGATSTFIIECRAETWHNAGLDEMSETESLVYCSTLFADHLEGYQLLSRASRWNSFITVKNERWYHENVVLVGDSAHTAHFSIGSGTKLAMEDAIALAQAFEKHSVMESALHEYEQVRKPRVDAFQQAAAESQRYFENVKQYLDFAPLQFTFHLLTRSGRITYDNLKQRDPFFVSDVDRWFVQASQRSSRSAAPPMLAPPAMFTPLYLRSLRLVNRVVLAPTSTYAAVDGQPNVGHNAQLMGHALGGAGLILTEPTAVSATGRITPGCTGLYNGRQAEAWVQIVEEIHQATNTKIALTLSHAGRRGSTRPRTRSIDQPLPRGNWPLIAASALPFSPQNQMPRAMDATDISWVCDEFVQAARRADAVGFDMLQLHMGHGYLLASFLSPLTNLRTDEYGGDLEGRMRFPLQVFDAVRAVWPQQKPLSVALPATDWVTGGLDVEDAILVALALKERGCDLITVIAGQTTIHARPHYEPTAYAQYSDFIRNQVNMPTLSTGYLNTSDQLNTLIAGGRADLCLFHPPLDT